MRKELQSIDVTASPELLDLAEEVERSGIGRLLKRGDHGIAILTPATARRSAARRPRRRAGADTAHDSILNIIGLTESAEPTDIARHELEYLAEAYDVNRLP